MTINLPENVKKILSTLEGAGFEAYAVGGCVRDKILGREPDDWDITTSATPEETRALFRRTVDTGIAHGTITVIFREEGYEVTTYRIDGEYQDGRHPSHVEFTPSLEEDLKRRDFTINAMAYNERDGLVDLFGGIRDLKEGRICCVGDARQRFSEDALRILRAVRFSAQLGFDIQKDTGDAICELADNLRKISAERIQVELVKLLKSSHPDYLRLAYEKGITRVILPEFDSIMETEQNNPKHIYTVGEHTLHALSHVEPDKVLRLATLFHDFGKPQCHIRDDSGRDSFPGHGEISAQIAGKILKRLKFDNDTTAKVTRLVRYHSIKPQRNLVDVRKAVAQVGVRLFPMLLKVKRGDARGQSPDACRRNLDYLNQVEALYQKVLERKDCLTLKDLAVTGRDLIEAGIKPGPELGRILENMLEDVLEHPEHNEKEYLLKNIEIIS